MRQSLIIAAIAALMATSAAAASKTEPDKGCSPTPHIPAPYPPVKARGVDANGHDCTGHPLGHASAGAKDTPIKAHTGSSAGEIRSPVSGTVK